jgi:multidrug resistance efflux pump
VAELVKPRFRILLFSPQKLTGQFIKSTQRLPVKISVANPDNLLKIGMLAVVWIEKDGR